MPNDQVVELELHSPSKSPLVLNREQEEALKRIVKALWDKCPPGSLEDLIILKTCTEDAEGPFRNE